MRPEYGQGASRGGSSLVLRPWRGWCHQEIFPCGTGLVSQAPGPKGWRGSGLSRVPPTWISQQAGLRALATVVVHGEMTGAAQR